MQNEFALDLSTARLKAGLTQEDCAHLLAIDRSRVSKLESGKRMPSIEEICTLSLIFGRTFESLFGSVFYNIREDLLDRLACLPTSSHSSAGAISRHQTLERLASRLSEEAGSNYEG